MKERPILFNGEMVRAIMDGRKTQTRRVVKPKPQFKEAPGNEVACWYPSGYDCGKSLMYASMAHLRRGMTKDFCPLGQPGDRLWVREAFYYEWHMHDIDNRTPDLPDGRHSSRLVYRASQPDYPVSIGVGPKGWTPSIHMPRWASRITLEITDVRVQRLQEISEEDAIAEGCLPHRVVSNSNGTGEYAISARARFAELWNSIYGPKDPSHINRRRKKGKETSCYDNSHKNKQCEFLWAASPWVWAVTFKVIDLRS